MQDGYIKLHRKSLTSSAFKNPATWMVWSWCLLKACHEEQQFPWNGSDITLKPGQFITGHHKALQELPTLTLQTLRTAWGYLKSTNRITIKSTNRFSIVTVLNWKEYQVPNKPTNKPLTNQQQTTNKPLTTYKNDKKVKNDKKEIPKGISRSKIDEVVSWYEACFDTTLRSLSKTRKAKLHARLTTFSISDIKQAITNFSAAPFYRGENDRGWCADLDFIIRSDEQIEKGLNLKPHSNVLHIT